VATLDDEGKEIFKEKFKEQINKAFKNPFQVQHIYNSIFENLT